MKRLLKATTAYVAAASFLQSAMVLPAAAVTSAGPAEPTITLATTTSSAGAAQARDPASATALTTAQKIALLRQKVKYVFVLFQENRSFEHYFGTYPGANGLTSTYPGALASDPYSQPANTFASYNSTIRNVDGTYSTVSPFLIPRTIQNAAGATVQLYPEDLYSVDHSHNGYINDTHPDLATKSNFKNDGYVLDQEGLHYSTDASGTTAPIVNGSGVAPTTNPTLQSKQKAEVVISHVDCDTVPFLWQYADRFAMFDNFHQTAFGPSTPNAIAMIGAQLGDTQWVKHGSNGAGTPEAGVALSVPNLTDTAPFPGSGFGSKPPATGDKAAVQPPNGPDESPNGSSQTGDFYSYAPQAPLTFASLPLSFAGNQIGHIISTDEHVAADLTDVQHDLSTIAAKNPSVDWGWYQQGYGPEPFDGTSISENGGTSFVYTSAPPHASYIAHHNGPQYFGYLGDNPQELAHLHGLQQFYTDVKNNALPANGGVFYVRGGYYNNDGLLPIDPNPTVKKATPGNDDHPNYADGQISEALVADSVNAIANSPYWADSAIIITYDETDGLYDHEQVSQRSTLPDGLPETGGPRIPAIVISPYAAAHTVSHVYSEHSSVVKFINELFGLVPLADLPDEAAARKAGAANAAYNAPSGAAQTNLGPADDLVPMGDMLEAFDNDRLLGNVAPLDASYAAIPAAAVTSLPHYNGAGCTALNITPTDYPNGYGVGLESDPPPADFNPRPVQSPGNPYLNTNNNTGGASTGPWPN